jgi:hypothetical protein
MMSSWSAAMKTCASVGGAVALVSAGPPISDLVETTLLAVLIQVAGDRTQALALVGGSSEPARNRWTART